MTNTATTAVRTVVTVDQAAELNDLFMQWLDTRPGLTAVDKRRRLRAANWQSCPPELFGQAKAMLQSWVA